MNYKTEFAIIKKEIYEHKGGFIYAPAILISVFFVLMMLSSFIHIEETALSFAHEMLIAGFFVITIFTSIYIAITLFFYYADAFTSDRKNNGLLFWKSMPMTDLKILGIKFFTGTIIVPIIITGWIIIASILTYVVGVMNLGSFDVFLAPWTALFTIFQLGIVTLILLLTFSLWVAPFYAWVALLSVFFKKWAIALAFVIPIVFIAMEEILFFDAALSNNMIWEFLAERLVGIFNEASLHNDSYFDTLENINFSFDDKQSTSFATILLDQLYGSLWHLLLSVKWIALLGGLIVSGVFVYIGSEYRRRFIQG